MIDFFVPGVPISQGSKRHIGGGRMIESSRKLAPWREKVAHEAARAMRGRRLYDEPVWEYARFIFWRPKAHYRSGQFSELLKPSAPLVHGSYPDAEKLARAINDAMEGIVFRNDSLVAQLSVEKVYGEQLGAWIAIGSIAEDEIPDRLLSASGGDVRQAVAIQDMARGMTPRPLAGERGSATG